MPVPLIAALAARAAPLVEGMAARSAATTAASRGAASSTGGKSGIQKAMDVADKVQEVQSHLPQQNPNISRAQHSTIAPVSSGGGFDVANLSSS